MPLLCPSESAQGELDLGEKALAIRLSGAKGAGMTGANEAGFPAPLRQGFGG